MARRLVSVQLDLMAQGYLREARAVLATTTTTTRAVDDLGDKVDATSRDMLQLATTTAVAKTQIDDLGDEARGTARDLTLLQTKIDATKLRIKELGLAFAASGDEGILGDIKSERGMLSQLERLRKELEKIDDLAAAKTVAPLAAGGGVGGLFSSIPRIGGVPGPAVAGIGAGIIALSPFLGGIIATTILGGVGTGGLIGGIALASQDTRVKAAWKNLGQEVFVDIGDAASPFVQPLTKAASIFGDAWRKELPRVQQDFKILATTVEPLALGVAGFARNLHPGLTTALKASVPLAERFSEDFAGLGTDLADFFRDLARSEPGAEAALKDFFYVLDVGLDGLGDGIEILSKTYEWANKLGGLEVPKFLFETPGLAIQAWRALNPELEKSVNNLRNVLTPTEELARAQESAADTAKRQADALAKLNKQVEDYYSNILKTFDADERWHRSLLDLNDSLKENGRTLDIHTRQGLANRDAIEEQFEATKARLDAGTLTEQQYQREIDSLLRLKKEFRDTSGFVDSLVAAYRKMPGEIRSTLSITAGGSGLSILLRLLKGTVTGSIPLSMGEHSGGQAKALTGSTPGVPGPGHGAFIEGLASGGDWKAGVPYLFGEHGPEVGVFSQPGTMYPTQQAYATAAGPTEITLRLVPSGDAAIDALITRISAEVSHRGGEPVVLGITKS